MACDEFGSRIDVVGSGNDLRTDHGRLEVAPAHRSLQCDAEILLPDMRIDERAARHGEQTEVTLDLAHGPRRALVDPALGRTPILRHQLLEHGQRRVDEVRFQGDHAGRQDRIAAQWSHASQMLGGDARRLVGQSGEHGSRNHRHAPSIHRERTHMDEAIKQPADVGRGR